MLQDEKRGWGKETRSGETQKEKKEQQHFLLELNSIIFLSGSLEMATSSPRTPKPTPFSFRNPRSASTSTPASSSSSSPSRSTSTSNTSNLNSNNQLPPEPLLPRHLENTYHRKLRALLQDHDGAIENWQEVVSDHGAKMAAALAKSWSELEWVDLCMLFIIWLILWTRVGSRWQVMEWEKWQIRGCFYSSRCALSLSRADLFATSHFLLRSNYQSLQKLRESRISNDTKTSNSNSPIEQPPSFPSSQDKAVENHSSGGMTSPVWEAEHRVYLSLKKVDEAREESLQWRGKLVSFFSISLFETLTAFCILLDAVSDL